MDPKGTIEVLKEIKIMSQVAIQDKRDKQKEQTTKKAKKNYIEAVNLDICNQENIVKSWQLESSNTSCIITSKDLYTTTKNNQITTNAGTNMGTSDKTSTNIEVKIPEWEESELKRLQQEIIDSSIFDIDDSSPEEALSAFEMMIDKHKLNILERMARRKTMTSRWNQ
ncbi:hypothetical protein F8M41_021628 [Gigaspora margarita]|uniref:Uncharacterized protein n=1 Tax=Gigaspora margarita TaxID=4874 RepID=A0A8H4B1K9_GIGMA|nr:hypothetical protein F8M41_021628 [Gigaspora margarita]